MRDKFNEQLEQLNVELIKMGALCEEAISAAAKALLEGDAALRETAAAAEREIDQKERDIESLCMKLLLQQQPVARDLRTISAALKMISDMERIGDQASDIAEITRDIEDSPVVSHVPIAEMARSTIGMVTDSIDSFVRKNLGLAQRRGVHRPADDRQISGAHRRSRRQHRRVGGVLPHRTARRYVSFPNRGAEER